MRVASGRLLLDLASSAVLCGKTQAITCQMQQRYMHCCARKGSTLGVGNDPAVVRRRAQVAPGGTATKQRVSEPGEYSISPSFVIHVPPSTIVRTP